MSIDETSAMSGTETLPTFTEFYRAINRREPFPWQNRLADLVAGREEWPKEIGIQTGLGKTACLEIAVWWLSSQAGRPASERTAPTRIWWVVNRRLLVDSTAEHAEALSEALRDPTSAGLDGHDAAVVRSIARRLRSLSADPNSEPIEVIRLRGGIASRTPTDPSCPAVILCTLPMYGSRLLFRGYGSRLRPIDAAMAGTDSLVLLDEAHLAPHLARLLPALAECTPNARPVLNEARTVPRLVALTATGDAAQADRFEIDEEDEANPIIRERLDAAKPLEIRAETRGSTAIRLVSATEQLLETASGPATCLIFANSPSTARDAFGRLRKRIPDSRADVLLLTGLVREHEAQRIRARVLDPVSGMASNAAHACGRERHLIVVATQTLEVGADIDAEFLVTEACGVRALTQRLGRLNRLGRCPHARAIYLHTEPAARKGADAGTWPVYGREPGELLKRLKRACGDGRQPAVSLPPRLVSRVLGTPADSAGRAPEVLPGLLWEWTKTTVRPAGEAPVEPYFSGIAAQRYSVSVVWRAHVPRDAGERLWPRATDREAIDVPIGDLRGLSWDESVHRIAADRVTMEQVPADELRPGDQIVLATDRGLLDEFGWNPTSSDAVLDVSLKDKGMPLDRTAIERICNTGFDSDFGDLIERASGASDHDDDPTDRLAAVEEILARIRAIQAPTGWDQSDWTSYVTSLQATVAAPRKEVARLNVANHSRGPRMHTLDETSIARDAFDLEQHCLDVAARSRAVAETIGLPAALCDAFEQAGHLHDFGKADRRFQRWLDPNGIRGGLVAKSGAPRHKWEQLRASAGWPRGGRHEALSCRLARLILDETSDSTKPGFSPELYRDLVLHLVVSHHGNGRPIVLPVRDGTPGTVSITASGQTVEVTADLETVDWEQPTRFRRLNERFGPWGLALLEAILIRSDHAVSADAEVAQ